MGRREDMEEAAVRDLGESIGYGRMMQLAEQIWNAKMPGTAHSTGPCVAFLVSCPCPEDGRDANGHCEWCCGAGRITEKVAAAIEQQRSLRAALKEALDLAAMHQRQVQALTGSLPGTTSGEHRVAELRKEFGL